MCRQGMVSERIFLLIDHLEFTNIKRQKPRSPDLIGTRMSEDTVPCLLEELTEIMQTLFKNLFNSIILLKISLFVIFNKIFHKPSVKGTPRYRKIIFFTTSALCKCIFRVK